MEIWVIVIIVILYYVFKRPSKCSICGVSFKRKYYKWTIEGKKQYLCPNCNRKMEKKISDSSFKKKIK